MAHDDALRDLPPSLRVRLERTASLATAAFERTIAESPRATLRPELRSGEVSRAMSVSLRPLVATDGSSSLDIGETLGEGGMGVVRLGVQRSLGRQVAVKTLRDDVTSPAARLRLLREAWIAATLEHPNVVPVYDLAASPDAAPVLVLRLIDGAPWSAFLGDPAAVRERFGAPDALDFHLRVLVSVCNAVALAHERGILHRDIKPENVMLGDHGQVYLVDWGIAVCVEPDETGRLPCVRDASELAGTPAYMAPEMLEGAVDRIGARSDVYLLGATLYEIVSGAPPHAGDAFAAIVKSILLGPRPLDEAVPEELRAIVARAMSPAPADRFPSVEDMRDALASYLAHRGALEIAHDAERSLAAARELRAQGAAEARALLYGALGEARFGFRRSLIAWPENARATEGLLDALRLGVDMELERGRVEAAESLVAEHGDAPADVVERVAAARIRRERESAVAERRARDFDPKVGRRTRMIAAIVFSTFWTFAPLLGAQLIALGYLTVRGAMVFAAIALFAVNIMLALWARESLLGTRLNRGLVSLGATAFAVQLMLSLGLAYADTPPRPFVLAHVALWTFGATAVGALLNRTWLKLAAAQAVAFVAVALWPDHLWTILALANATTYLIPLEEARRLRVESPPCDPPAVPAGPAEPGKMR